MSRSSTNGSAPWALTLSAVSLNFSQLRATRTTPEKSSASLMAVARPMPWLAPVTIATEFFMTASSSTGVGFGLGKQIRQFAEKRRKEGHDRQHQEPCKQRCVEPVVKKRALREKVGACDRGRDSAGYRGLHGSEQKMRVAPWNPEHQ